MCRVSRTLCHIARPTHGDRPRDRLSGWHKEKLVSVGPELVKPCGSSFTGPTHTAVCLTRPHRDADGNTSPAESTVNGRTAAGARLRRVQPGRGDRVRQRGRYRRRPLTTLWHKVGDQIGNTSGLCVTTRLRDARTAPSQAVPPGDERLASGATPLRGAVRPKSGQRRTSPRPSPCLKLHRKTVRRHPLPSTRCHRHRHRWHAHDRSGMCCRHPGPRGAVRRGGNDRTAVSP
jgi:hypothetical protein